MELNSDIFLCLKKHKLNVTVMNLCAEQDGVFFFQLYKFTAIV